MSKKMFLVCALCFIFLSQAQALPAMQKLTVVLDWFINPDHAPLFVAEEQGFFKKEGLEIKLITPADSSDPPKLIAAGKGDLAITYEPEFIDQIEQGLPLSAIGTLIDKPLNCLMVLDKGPIKSLADLKNKRIGSSTGGVVALLLKTMLQKQGLKLQDVEMINVRHNSMQALLAGKVDAITGVMRNIETPELELNGQKPRLFLPEANGIPTYSELIFIASKTSLQDTKRKLALQHFFLALEKAVVYLKQHPEESWRAFSKKYPALNNELNHRAWYASLPYFTAHPNGNRAEEWRAFISYMRQNGLIKLKRNLSDYLTEI